MLRLAYRMATEISPRLAWKAGHLWVVSGDAGGGGLQEPRPPRRAVPALSVPRPDQRLQPPLPRLLDRKPAGPSQQLPLEDVDGVIAAGKRQRAYFYTLLGGEPMLYAPLWDIIGRHPDCYFQIITNGMFLSAENVARIRAAGNVTPLVSLDGGEENNDARRGQGVFQSGHATAWPGCSRPKSSSAWPPPSPRPTWTRSPATPTSASSSPPGRCTCGTTSIVRWGPIPRPSSAWAASR